MEGTVPHLGGQPGGDSRGAALFREGVLMAVKVVRRRELTFWEKLYVPQILCGLRTPFRHFFRTLFLPRAPLLGRFTALPASATIQYPEELRPLMSRFRSRHRL